MRPVPRAALTALAVTALFLAIVWLSTSPWLDVLTTAFWVALVAGVLVRGWRAERRRVRTALSPVADAADAYQDLLLGRPSGPVRYGREEPTATSLVVDAPKDPLVG
jgi:hypothetical protein